MSKERLVTPDYCLILAANFLLYFAFYLILPILPFYLNEVFSTGNATAGIILSSYTVASLMIRPFSGYILDTFSRKPLYLLSYLVFTACFAGYIFAGILLIFILLRIMHGLAFGMVTVGGNTIVIDITPSSRRGEAVGYYGLMNNIAMSIGPMTGLFLHDYYPFETIFTWALISSIAGLAAASMVHTPVRPPVKREPVSLDRFILLKGIPAGISLLLLSIPYGMTHTYVAMYAKEIGIGLNSGLFFTCMATGMAVSRMFSGKQVDKGHINQIIILGMFLVSACFFLLAACGTLMKLYPQFTETLFFLIALLLGVGFGSMFPAFNTLFVNLAPNNQRGTATSTYLTSWDVGLGFGLMAGGIISDKLSFDAAYFFGATLTVVSIIYFIRKAGPHFLKNKLR